MNESTVPELPIGWVWTGLGEIAEVITGNTPSKKDFENYGDYIPFVKTPELNDCVVSVASDNLSEKGAKLARILPPDSVMVSCIGNLGKIGINKIPVAFNQQINSIIFPKDEIIPKYGFYYFQSLEIKKWLNEIASATTISIVNKSKFETTPIPLPPLPEQHRIVTKIEELFTRLDAGVSALKKTQAQLKRYRQSILKAACEGKLVPTEAELAKAEGIAYEPADVTLARILKERREKWNGKGKYKEPMSPDSGLPDIPEGWVWATIEQLAASEPYAITDGPFGSNLKTSHYTETGPRVIRLQNIGDGFFSNAYAHISQQHYDSLSKHRVQAGDLVIAALGERPPRSCVIPSSVGPAIVKADCIRFKPDNELALNVFLNLTLNSEPTRTRTACVIHGMGRPRLNLGEVKSILLSLPPLPEQRRIVTEVERRLSIADGVEKTVGQSHKLAERLRQSILKKAFEGRLVAQDASDEPAGVLLERIKLEKMRTGNGTKKSKQIKLSIKDGT